MVPFAVSAGASFRLTRSVELLEFPRMTKSGSPRCFTASGSRIRFPFQLNWVPLLVFLAAFLAAPARAEGPDDDYLRIFGIIEKADTLSQNNQVEPARAKYQEAQVALAKLRRDYPSWNPKTVTYRINYVTEKLSTLTAPKTETATTAPATASSSGAKLLDAGAEPRKMFRLQPKPGEKQTLELSAKSSMGVGAAGGKIEMIKTPGLKVTFSVVPKSVSDSGDIEYEEVIEGADMVAAPDTPKELIEILKATIASANGFSLKATMSDRGVSKKAEARIPANANAELRESLEGLKNDMTSTTLVLPDEAIGQGARWEHKEKTKSEGMMIDQVTTYQLLAIEGDMLTVKCSTIESAANQKVSNPVMPNAKADLVKLAGTSTAEMTVDPTRLLPIRATVQERRETTLKMDVAGQKQTITQKESSDIVMESK